MSDSLQNDRLFSAFLDGELGQEQRESVEKRIASDQSLQTLLQQWKDQGNAIRSIPKHQLRRDLSQPVLDEIKRRRLTGELPDSTTISLAENRLADSAQGSASRNTWRTALIAISSLAGMILLGFFLLRPEPKQMAKHANDARGDLTAKSDPQIAADAQKPLSAADRGVELQRDKKSSIENPDSMHFAPGFKDVDSSTAADVPALVVDNAPGSDEAKKAIAGNDFLELAEETKTESISDDMTILDPGARAKGGAGTEDIIAEQDIRSINLGSDREKATEPTDQFLARNITGQTVSIPQVYFVEFTTKEQPLAVVSEVFSRNQIEIQTPEGFESGSQKPSTVMLKTLAAQSNQGLEAIYVVATRSQLSRAITELSDRANISGFEVTSLMLEKMLAPTATKYANEIKPTEPRMDEMIAKYDSLSSGQLFNNKLQKSDGQESLARSVPEPGAPVRVRAMAQQLHPFERKQRLRHTQFEGLTQPKDSLGASGQVEESDTLDQLIRSKAMPPLNWNYSRGDSGAASPPMNDSPTGQKAAGQKEAEQKEAEQKGEEEMVQFLLLVRSNPPE